MTKTNIVNPDNVILYACREMGRIVPLPVRPSVRYLFWTLKIELLHISLILEH